MTGRPVAVDFSSLAAPATLALAHVYCFRLATGKLRGDLWNALRSALNALAGRPRARDDAEPHFEAPSLRRAARARAEAEIAEENRAAAGKAGSFAPLRAPGRFEAAVAHAKRRFGRRFALGDGVALNAALAENLCVFVRSSPSVVVVARSAILRI